MLDRLPSWDEGLEADSLGKYLRVEHKVIRCAEGTLVKSFLSSQIDISRRANYYQSWQGGLSKARALQAAQIAWLEAHQKELYSHPGYWAPFILIGNWL